MRVRHPGWRSDLVGRLEKPRCGGVFLLRRSPATIPDVTADLPLPGHSPTEPRNVDPVELEKFQSIAAHWWDPDSEFGPLHRINPLRLQWIESIAPPLAGLQIVDVGCGGGILSESLAQRGATVLGIDLAERSIEVAELHALDSGVENVHYRCVAAETLADERPGAFDVVTCMEMLEHVPDPESIVRACSTLVKPGGWVFLSTIHRSPKAFAFAILGAEYLLRLLPRGTHDYGKFIRPSELTASLRRNGLEATNFCGLQYNPLTDVYRLAPRDVSVNYMIAARKPSH